MPRKARQKSHSGIYHVVTRGIDRQIMFEEPRDYRKYLEILSLYKDECHFELYAFCLMTNHVHLILRETDISIETIFRKINTHYSLWFNLKYQRTGHLQQERYYSEPIEDIDYLLTAIRYVHRNPMKAGLESFPGEKYSWSSYEEYITGISGLVDTSFIYKIIPKESFIQFSNQAVQDSVMDIDNIKKRIPDDVAKEIIQDITGCTSSTEFQKIEVVTQKKYIIQLKQKGLSVRQINRLTGVPRGIIERQIQKAKGSSRVTK